MKIVINAVRMYRFFIFEEFEKKNLSMREKQHGTWQSDNHSDFMGPL